MHALYLVVTLFAVALNGYAASLNFLGAESVKAVADRIDVSRRRMLPFGVLLLSGAVGLLVGLWVPALGIAAATGLVLYFLCAVGAHVRVGDPKVGGAIFFLVAATAALAGGLGYHYLR